MDWFAITMSIVSNSLPSRCPVTADMNTISAYNMKDSVLRTFSVKRYMVLSSFSIASHLFTAMMMPLPLSCAIPAILASCSVTPSTASITSTTTSARSTALTVRMIIKRSSSSLILFFRRSPAVSINTYSLSLYTICVSMASRVVPAISDTITRSSPAILLMMDDFPTFGFPTMAIRGLSSSSSVNASLSKYSVTASSISPRPSLLTDEIGYGSPIPRL